MLVEVRIFSISTRLGLAIIILTRLVSAYHRPFGSLYSFGTSLSSKKKDGADQLRRPEKTYGAKYEKDFLMGDLNKQTFKEIIESDRYWNVVDKVKN